MWDEIGGTNNQVYYLGMTKVALVTTYWGAFAGTTTGVQDTVQVVDRPTAFPTAVGTWRPRTLMETG